jgi:predicted nucleic acid-binding protein
MTADCLLDTNVLVYAVDSTPANRAKQAQAIELIERVDFGLSAQVLQEFYVTVTRKLARPLTADAALQFLDRFRAFPMVSVDQALVVEGIRNSVKFQLSYWDGAILAAAEQLHARILYSEDLNHEQRYGEVVVRNPFCP